MVRETKRSEVPCPEKIRLGILTLKLTFVARDFDFYFPGCLMLTSVAGSAATATVPHSSVTFRQSAALAYS